MLTRLMTGRRSCRAFLPEPVDRDTVEAILQLAQRTASWCNTQPWQVIVTAGEETGRFRAALAAAATTPGAFDLDEPSYHGTFLERRRAAAWQLYNAVGVVRGDQDGSRRQTLRNYHLFGAPHVAIITSDRALGSYGVLDCGDFIQAFLLAAEAFGVATIAQASIASHAGLVRTHFSLPDDRIVICGISFGLADSTDPANGFTAARASLSEAVSWLGDGWAVI